MAYEQECLARTGLYLQLIAGAGWSSLPTSPDPAAHPGPRRDDDPLVAPVKARIMRELLPNASLQVSTTATAG